MLRTCYRMCDPDSSTVTSRNHFMTSQITCLEFVGQYLFAGEGSWLHIFQITTLEVLYITRWKVFKAQNVHGIRPENSEINASTARLCVFGGRCMKILRISLKSDSVSLNTQTDVIKFQDWIWDVRWLHNGCIALLLAHNYVIFWSPVEEKQQKVSKCSEKCILYCGLIVGTDLETAGVFSGTVFKEILIWCPNDIPSHEDDKILHRLKGHDGVIFCITYHEKLRKLCSSSDDRSIQIWHHEIKTATSSYNIWKRSSFIFLHRLYGHEARVWKVAVLTNFYISCGEDSLLCIWNGDESDNNGALVKKTLCHAGSSIRSLAVTEDETLVVTGGGDGSIKLWSLTENEYQTLSILGSVTSLSTAIPMNKIMSPSDYPRELYMLDEYRLLVMTNDGILIVYDMMSNNASVCLEDARFKSYSIIDAIDIGHNNCVIFIGDISGSVTLLRTVTEDSALMCLGYSKICDGKIFALQWIDQNFLLTCESQGKMTLWDVQFDGCCLKPKCMLELPKTRQRWFATATAVIQKDKISLICGCRDGGVHLYIVTHDTPLTTVLYPIQSFPQLHGCNGVTNISCNEDGVYSSGRDGFVTSFELVNNRLTILRKSWITGCPKWISGIMKLDDDMVVYGFHSYSFILWSEKQQIVLWEVPCGGGHRSWSFKLHHDIVTFAFIKGREIEFHKAKVRSSIPVSVKSGFHKRAICSIQHLFTLRNKIVCVTASEDTTLGIISFQGTGDSYYGSMNYTLKGHISSVKATAFCSWQETGKSGDILLVSVGGRAQMICWRITINEDLCLDAINSTPRIQEISSHMLNPEGRNVKKPWKKQTMTFDPETRYMDVSICPLQHAECGSLYLIAIACSDSYLRIFSLNSKSGVIKLLIENPLHGHCMLKAQFCCIGNDELLITTATDGKAIFWHITNMELSYLESSSNKNNLKNKSHLKCSTEIESLSAEPIVELQLHQSGITALAIIRISQEIVERQTFLIATGGDDTLINISTIEIQLKGSSVTVHEVSRVTIKGHSAQITGLHFFTPQVFASSSVDQRICIWHSEHADETKTNNEFKLKSYEISNIPDIASLTGWTDRGNAHYICVAGRGLELCKIIQ